MLERRVSNRQKSGATRRRFKRSLWRRGKHACYRCGERIATVEEATLDHVVPMIQGGADNLSNLALSHDQCNQDHGHSLLSGG